ncbi:SPOR domain-containing protein [Desulfurobacterium sp.]
MKKTLKVFLILTFSIIFSINFLNKAFAKETPVYTIQLTNTKSKKEAERIFNKIQNLEYSRIDKVKTRYKVRVGLFKTKQEAKNYLKKHPEIKKISPSAYITLNYYNPERTIKKGYFPSKKKKPEGNQTNKKEQPKQKTIPSKEKNTLGNEKTTTFKQTEKKGLTINLNNPIFRKYLLWIIMAISGTVAAIIAVVLVRKFNVEETLCCITDKFQNAYINALKCIPLKTSKKILEYHYRKIGDFRSLILMKLQDQDFNFILRETPKYLLKHPEDILVWKIYIEVLAQLGIYSEAATACEKLAEILRKNARPEAAENYLKKAEEYRKKAAKPIENAG